jgi:hypothetical protein
MYQGVVQFTVLVLEGFGSNGYHWNGDNFLRSDRARGCVELLHAEDGYGWELAAEMTWSALDEESESRLREARLDGDPEAMFVALARIAQDHMQLDFLIEEDLRRYRTLSIHGERVDEMLQRRGKEERLLRLLAADTEDS